MKLFYKEKLSDGTRNFFAFGIKLMSYRRKKYSRNDPRILNCGTDNRIILANSQNPNLGINIYGNNNTVEICTEDLCFCGSIWIGTGDSPANGCHVLVGKNTTANGFEMRLMEDGSSITIGEDCMLSSDIYLLASDTHCIFDESGNLINIGRKIEIGNHVWIGQYCKILKNTCIGDNSIVGMGSIVTSCFQESNCIVAGVPAKIVKRKINWDRRRPQQYINSNF